MCFWNKCSSHTLFCHRDSVREQSVLEKVLKTHFVFVLGREENEMQQIEIKSLVLGPVSTNCYIVWNKTTKEAVIIDPADNADRIREVLVQQQLSLTAILLTHGHFDHIFAVNDLVRMFKVPVYCEESEQEMLMDADLNLSSMMGGRGDYTTVPTNLLKDEEEISLIGCKIKVLHTPGHTKGGACYYFVGEGVIFVGDTIFLESVGRTDFPTGNLASLIQSIQKKLYVLDDEIKLYTGHGPATTIGYEKENNPYTSQEGFWD